MKNKDYRRLGEDERLLGGDRWISAPITWNQPQPEYTDAEVHAFAVVGDGAAGYKTTMLDGALSGARKAVVYRPVDSSKRWMSYAVEWLQAWAAAHPQQFVERAISALEEERSKP